MYYHFETVWQPAAPADVVFNFIYNSDTWPTWWRGVLAVENITSGNPNGIGDVKRYTWKSILPYRLIFDMELTEKIPNQKLVGKATGELQGDGTWTVEKQNNLTTITYIWRVKTTKKWMNFLAPIAKPFFAWNHNVVMDWGRQGLAKQLNMPVISLKG